MATAGTAKAKSVQNLTFSPSQLVSLKTDPAFDEAWLEGMVRDNPELLGLGHNLKVIECQRSIGKGGRIDMIVEDTANQQVFIVELMLGKLDASHLVRALDYCLREQSRQDRKGWDFVAVLVAENVLGTRYSRVAQLLTQRLKSTMPVIFMEMAALRVQNLLTFKFTKIFDATEEEEELTSDSANSPKTGGTDTKLTPDAKQVVSQFGSLLKKIDDSLSLTYKKFFIGVASGNRAENFVSLSPKKQFVRVRVTVTEPNVWAKKLDKAGIDVMGSTEEKVRFRITSAGVKKNGKLLHELFKASYEGWFK